MGWIVAALLAALPSAAAAGEVWDDPAFSVAPKKLLRAAQGVTVDKGHDVVILLEQGNYSFDEAGRRTYEFRRIYRVLTQDGVDEWSSISLSWSPWYQKRPELRVRVVSPDGKTHELDEATIDVAPAPTGSDHVYDNRRTLRAPFPAVSIGAVIEERVVYEDTKPLLAEGQYGRFYVSASVPVHRSRVVIERPKQRKMKITKHLLPKHKLRTTRKGKLVRTVLTARDLPADEPSESFLPGDVDPYPHVAYTTGTSWNAVAKAYHTIVERQIADGDVAALAKQLPSGGDRQARIEAALALVNDNVRYTGIELGMNSIVPWSPAETWKRKFGDCKDKATLLVALLRRAGIEARVALLNAGYGVDSDPKMPGLGWFNHVIVYIPGKPAIWIDPTNEFARAGELPASDQGRWALVAGPTTKRVVRTPMSKSTDNQFIERRVVHLAEEGPSRIVETSTLQGTFERHYRAEYRAADPKKAREALTQYVQNEYLAKELVEYSHSESSDLSKPFELRVEAAESSRAFSDSDVAYVFMFPVDLLVDVYSELKDTDEDAKRRNNDLFMPAFVREVRYEIAPPAGFALRDLPEAETLQLGPMRITTQFKNERSGVEAVLRLDTVKPRFTPDEVDAVRAAVKQLSDRPGIQIVFDQVGMRHLNAGDIDAALREFRRLAKLHPKEALHRGQIALALLEAGLAKQARAQAKQGVKLEPKSATARSVYAWVLQHDDLGRRFGPGWFRKEVIREYRSAIELDPQWVDPHANLAIVYEYDDAGRRYRGELDKAIAAYQRLRKETDSKGYDLNLLLALLHAGRYEEARKLAKSLGSSYASHRLVAAAAKGGAKGLAREVRAMGLSGSALSEQLQAAALTLLTLREYSASAAALRESAGAAPNAAALRSQADWVAKVQRYENGPIAKSDPRYVVVELMSLVFDAEYLDEKGVLDLMSKRARAGATRSGFGGAGMRLMRKQLSEAGLSQRTIVDLAASLMDLRVEAAKPWGWKVEMRGNEFLPMPTQTLFVVREGKRFRIVGFSTAMQTMAAHAFDLANRNKVDGAAQWLDWTRQHLPPELKGSVLHKSAFKVLWPEVGKRTRLRARLAAAALMAWTSEYADQAIPVLEKCTSKNEIVRQACAIALYRAYKSAGKFEKARAQLKRLQKALPNEDEEVWRAERAFLDEALGHFDDIEARAKQQVKRDPKDRGARRTLARVAIGRGQIEKAVDVYAELIAESDPYPGDLNQFAWLSLFLDRSDDEVLAAAQRAVRIGQRKQSPSLNTLAAVHAARGEYRMAYQVMIESMDAGDATELRPQDWLVIGRITAGLGYAKDAAAAYGRVEPDDGPILANMSSHALAAQWKRKLRANKK